MSALPLKRGPDDELRVNLNSGMQPIARLISLIPGKEKTIELMYQPVITIGRSRNCDVILAEPDISTEHALLYVVEMDTGAAAKNQLLNLVDKSRNGTFVNGNKLVKKDRLLKTGDKLVFGKSCSFLFNYTNGRDDIQDTQVFKKPSISSSQPLTSVRSMAARPRLTSFFDKYTLGRELGTGHYAIVKEATVKRTGQTVAVKIFHPQQNDDHKKNKLFREETEILMRIQHPNIVNLLDSFVEPVSKSQIQKYLVLEKIDDGELFERIVRKTSLREAETQALFKQLVQGLEYLHEKNIIHRDIKPENILLHIRKRTSADEKQLGPWDPDEIDIQVKIADFGLAKFTGEMLFTNTLCGTPSYVAPEVLTKQGYTSKVDMWSAGVILYVCLCGFPPFSDQLGPPSLKEQILQAKFAFYSPYWDNINDTALHLISNLLVLDAEKRFGVTETLNHQWLQNVPSNNVETTMQRLKLNGNRLPKTYTELSCL